MQPEISADDALPWSLVFAGDCADSVRSFFEPGIVPRCFPFYIHDPDGANRRENITDWALDRFRAHYNDKVISKWSIFDYVYGILHHPGYRARFGNDVRTGLPPIPLAPDFRAFQRAGQQLIRLHLDYQKVDPLKLATVGSPGVPSSKSEDSTRLSMETMKIVNELPEKFS